MMSRSVSPLLAGIVGMAVAGLSSPALAQSLCPAQLPNVINPIIKQTGGQWGVMVQPVGDRTPLYNWNATTQFIPASTNKLLTSAAALQKFGANYRIRTSVTGRGTGSVLSSLRLIGRGDPSLTTAKLSQLAQQLRQRGIRQVNQLIGDDTYFRGAAINPNWHPDDLTQAYASPVNSLILNQNAINLTVFPQRVGQALRVQWDDPSDASDWRLSSDTATVGANGTEYLDIDRSGSLISLEGQLRAGSESEGVGVSVPNPGNYLVQKFRNVLTRSAIQVDNSTLVKSTPAPVGEVELAFVESAPMSELIYETNQESNNLYAEALLKGMGSAQTPTSLDATASGAAAVKSILAPLGVNPNGYTMVDGSGLARRNRVSSQALVQVLQAMAQSPHAEVFRRSLPIGGVSGTLKSRFRGTPLQGRVFAKTGTISGAIALAGYVNPPNYSPLSFSILVNYSGSSVTTLRRSMDQVVQVLGQLRPCR